MSDLFPSRQGRRRRDPATGVIVAVGVATIVLWALAHTTTGSVRELGVNGAQLAAATMAAVVPAWRLQGVRGRPRRQLALLSVAGGAWAAGQLYWTVTEARGSAAAPFPSAADVGFVLVYPGMLLAVLSSPWSLHRASRVRTALDGLVVVLSVAFSAWVLALDTAFGDDAQRSAGEVLALAYPLADIVVVALTVTGLVRLERPWRRPFVFVAMGFLFHLVADAGFAYLEAGAGYRTGSVVDLGWILGWLMVAAAGAAFPLAEPAERGAAAIPSRAARLVQILSLAGVTALAVVLHAQGRPFTSDTFPWWTGLALFGVNVARTAAARAEADVMVSELARNMEMTEELLAEHRLALEAAQLGTWRWYVSEGTLHWSAELEAIYGLTPGAFGGTVEELEAMLVPDEVPHVRAMLAACARSDRGTVFEHRIVRPDGSVGWIQSCGRALRNDTGALVGIIGVAFETTARHDAERALRVRAEQSAAVAELGKRTLAAPTLAASFDAAVTILASTLGVELCKVLELEQGRSSLRLVAGCGWTRGLVGVAIVESGVASQAGFTLDADEPVVVDDLLVETRFSGPSLLTDHGVRSGMSVVISTKSGAWGVLGAHTTELRHFSVDDVNFLRAVAATVAAAVDFHAMTGELVRRSLHDELTGLPNRALLGDRLSVAIADARRTGGYVAVLHIGMDRFTLVNESYGEEAGDRALVEISRRISRCCGPSGTAARWGGDEFVLAVTVVDKHTGVELAARLLAALSEPLLMEQPLAELFLTPSIGLAVANGVGDASAVLRDAGVAARRASELGGRRYELFDDSLRARTVERLQTEREIRRGLVDGQFEAHYQPIVRTVDGAMVGVEALARWRHPTRGLLSPDEFLRAAEVAGLVDELGRQILVQAAIDAARWNHDEQRLRVSVNVSTSQLVPSLVETLTELLTVTGAAPENICIEILETALADLSEPVAILGQLREKGLPVFIDDFGTGHSSLARLAKLPVDGLKIDRAFVTDITESRTDRAVAAGVVQLGHVLGLTVTAEGVETAEQLAVLAELQCEHAQGWLFARALPAHEIDDLLGSAPTAFRRHVVMPRAVEPGPAVARDVGDPSGPGAAR